MKNFTTGSTFNTGGKKKKILCCLASRTFAVGVTDFKRFSNQANCPPGLFSAGVEGPLELDYQGEGGGISVEGRVSREVRVGVLRGNGLGSRGCERPLAKPEVLRSPCWPGSPPMRSWSS